MNNPSLLFRPIDRKDNQNPDASFNIFDSKKNVTFANDPGTSKPIFGSTRKPTGVVQVPYANRPQNLNFASPLVPTHFAKGMSQKKRDFSEISQPYYSAKPNQFTGSNYYTFEDNSTLKPYENTVIRNPSLMGFGLGQRDASLKNSKGLNIQPLNLSQSEFRPSNVMAQDDSESDYYTARKANMSQTVLGKSEAKLDSYTKQELNQMCERSAQIIQMIAQAGSDIYFNDISLVNSKGKQYEFVPLQFIVTNQQKLPQTMLNMIADSREGKFKFQSFGLLENIQTVYFAFDKTVKFYPLSFGVGNEGILQRVPITHSNIPQDMIFDQIVTCVTVCDLIPGMKQKSTDDKILLVATASLIKIFILRKNNRDNKLSIEETSHSLSIEVNSTVTCMVQMKKNGRVFYGTSSGKVHEIILKESRLQSMFSFISNPNKRLAKHDSEKDSVVKTLLNGFFNYFEKSKSIFDLKVDESRNYLYALVVTTDSKKKEESLIEVYDLGIVGTKFKKIMTINHDSFIKKALEFQNRYATSQDIEEISEQYQVIHISPIQVNESNFFHLMAVTRNGQRIYLNFEQDENKTPSERDLNIEGAQSDFIFGSRFSGHWHIANILGFPSDEHLDEVLDSATQIGIYKVHSLTSSSQHQFNVGPKSLAYNNLNSYLVYSDQSDLPLNELSPELSLTRSLKLSFIKKNECTYSHLKMLQNLQAVHMNEHFSHIQVVQEYQRQPNFQLPLHLQEELEDERRMPEEVLEIKTYQMLPSKEIQQLLGLNRSAKDYKDDDGQIYPYLSLSELERQVYLMQSRVNILTDQRVIEVQNVRPNDSLAMILHQMSRAQTQAPQDDFEDFIDQYSIKETCCMLVQLLVDNGLYLFSRRIEDLTGNNKLKNRRQAQSQPRQTIRGGAGSKSSLYMSPYGVSARPSQYSALLPDNRQPSELIKFNGSEAAKEYVLKNCHADIKSLALQFLITYGDTISQTDLSQLENEQLLGLPSNLNDFSSNLPFLTFFSDKHYSLYLYLQRVIRPLWNAGIVYAPDSTKPDKVAPSFENLKPVIERLRGLQNLINYNQTSFYGEQATANDLIFRNQALLNQFCLVSDLPFDQRENLETMERNSLNNLKVFIQRCIDVINLLGIISFDGNYDQFNKLWSKLSKDNKAIIRNLKFSDLMTTQFNGIIRKVLEASVLVVESDPQKTTELIKQTAEKVDRLCKSFFTREENTAFIGESLLQTALKEKNLHKKEQLMKQALEQLSSDPTKIDFNSIKGLLVENGNFSTLADLLLRKIKAFKVMNDSERVKFDQDEVLREIEQCQELLLSLLVALDISINNQMKEYKDVLSQGSNKLDQSSDVLMFLKKLNQTANVEIKINILNKVLQRVELFNDQEVLLLIFEYLITKPTSNIDLDLLPHINKESFNKLCDATLAQRRIQLEKYQSLLKLLSKNRDAERMSKLVLSVVNDQKEIYKVKWTTQAGNGSPREDQERVELSMQEKLIQIKAAQAILKINQAGLRSDSQQRFLKDLKTAETQCQRQLKITQNMTEKLQGLRNLPQVPETENLINVILQKKEQLEQKLISTDDLMSDIIDLELHESLIDLLINDQDFTHKQQQNIETAIQNLVEEIFQLFHKQTRSKVIEKFKIFVDNAQIKGRNKPYIQTMIKSVQQSIDKLQSSEASLIEDLQKLVDGKPLFDTRFWLIEYVFEEESLDLAPTDIIGLLEYGSSLSPRINLSPDMILAKLLCMLKLWIKKNETLFGLQPIPIIQSNTFDINFNKTPKDTFIQDLKTRGQTTFNQAQDKIQALMAENRIVFEKQICQLIEKLIQDVQNGFQTMLNQHNIQSRFPHQSSLLPMNSTQKNFLVTTTFPKNRQSREEYKHGDRSQIIQSNNMLFEDQQTPMRSPFNPPQFSSIPFNKSAQIGGDTFSLGKKASQKDRSPNDMF